MSDRPIGEARELRDERFRQWKRDLMAREPKQEAIVPTGLAKPAAVMAQEIAKYNTYSEICDKRKTSEELDEFFRRASGESFEGEQPA